MIRFSLVPTTLRFGVAIVVSLRALTPSFLYTFRSVVDAVASGGLGKVSKLAREKGLLLSITVSRDDVEAVAILARAFKAIARGKVPYATSIVLDSPSFVGSYIGICDEILVLNRMEVAPAIPYVDVAQVRYSMVRPVSRVVARFDSVDKLVDCLNELRKFDLAVVTSERISIEEAYSEAMRRGIDAELHPHARISVREAFFNVAFAESGRQ